ncbi:MAG: hypothetical protein ACR5K2_02530 [Wolbachia sp.]
MESQIAELERRIVLDGYKLLGEYIFTDDSCNGLTLEREGLKNLCKSSGRRN